MRVAIHTKIAAGHIADYEEAHRQVPPALVRAIRDAGATDWTIWRSGTDLFHTIECADYARFLAVLEHHPANLSWASQIGHYLEVLHDYSAGGGDATLPVVWDLGADLAKIVDP